MFAIDIVLLIWVENVDVRFSSLIIPPHASYVRFFAIVVFAADFLEVFSVRPCGRDFKA